MRSRDAVIVLVGSLPPAALAAGPPQPPLHQLLDRAGRYVETLEEQLAVVVGEETYEQYLFLGPASSPNVRRSLVSDVAWVPTGDSMVWAFYRDVRAVDGKPIGDRVARLEALFPRAADPGRTGPRSIDPRGELTLQPR